MNTPTFDRVLQATGYLRPSGRPAPGLTLAHDEDAPKLQAVFKDERVGLNADAVFSAQSVPTTIFKDAAEALPGEEDIRAWHEAAWNIGVAPLLWIITPTDVRLYNCYASSVQPGPLDHFLVDSEDRLRALDTTCGRLATETGAFWSGRIGKKIDRRHRVDRALLGEINALEQHLVDLTPNDAPSEYRALARDFAQRFIGRCIFTWYLLDRELAQPFLPNDLPADLGAMFATPNRAFRLFDWLRDTFNGDLFPMDDPGAEREHLTPRHLAYICDFVEGRSLCAERRGQGRLFRFRFSAIPIDLISAIYQQFARSSALEEADSQGLHYTPIELVHLTLDPVFEGLRPSSRVIDPACGSGAFLVEAFRRLVWRATRGTSASRRLVRGVLYNQLYGMDINRSALGIAAFSLYLAALELDEEPVNEPADLKFDHLIDKTLFEWDSISGTLPPGLGVQNFDAVVGNPTWTFVGQGGQSITRVTDQEDTLRPRRSPDQAFLGVARRLVGETGRIGMIVKATPFFSKDVHAVNARNALFNRLAPVALINISCLRREGLFPDVSGPALLFFSRCALATDCDRMLVGSIPWTPDFKRTGVFHIGPGEVRPVRLDRVLARPPMLKAATFGTIRDGWLIEKLERDYSPLENVLNGLGRDKTHHRGQGFQVSGDANTPPEAYRSLRVVTSDTFTAFRLKESRLEAFRHETLHRPRRPSIFKGPLLLCPKAANRTAVERGRYSAAVHEGDVLYTESFYGISFYGGHPVFAYLLSGILNSGITAFQLAFGGPTWGLERPTVEPYDLLSLRVPGFVKTNPAIVEGVLRAERGAAGAPGDRQKLVALDEAVFDLYELDPEERVLAADSVDRARDLIFENRKERARTTSPPGYDVLEAYAGRVAESINTYLRAQDSRHVEAAIYRKRFRSTTFATRVPGVTAVRFAMVAGGPGSRPVVREGDPADLDALVSKLEGHFEAETPPYLNERRQLRIYGDDDLFILKPTEVRYWTRTAGLNDADIILADHWLGRRDAVSHS